MMFPESSLEIQQRGGGQIQQKRQCIQAFGKAVIPAEALWAGRSYRKQHVP